MFGARVLWHTAWVRDTRSGSARWRQRRDLVDAKCGRDDRPATHSNPRRRPIGSVSQLLTTGTRFDCASVVSIGTRTSRMPSLYVAVTSDSVAPGGIRMDRSKEPYWNSDL